MERSVNNFSDKEESIDHINSDEEDVLSFPSIEFIPDEDTTRSVAEQNGFEFLAYDAVCVGTDHRFAEFTFFTAAIMKAYTSGNGREDFSIRLEGDPDNAYDKFAIKVIGSYSDDEIEHNNHIGYIPRKLAYKIGMNWGTDAPPLYALFHSLMLKSSGFELRFSILLGNE